MNDPNTKYVVVFNRDTYFVPSVRHIVTYRDYDCEEDFWEWYNSEFMRLDGDKMKTCDTMAEAISFARKIEEDE